jgi:hypothetical protein
VSAALSRAATHQAVAAAVLEQGVAALGASGGGVLLAADADRLIGELAAQTANPPVAAQPVIGRAVTVKG